MHTPCSIHICMVWCANTISVAMSQIVYVCQSEQISLASPSTFQLCCLGGLKKRQKRQEERRGKEERGGERMGGERKIFLIRSKYILGEYWCSAAEWCCLCLEWCWSRSFTPASHPDSCSLPSGEALLLAPTSCSHPGNYPPTDKIALVCTNPRTRVCVCPPPSCSCYSATRGAQNYDLFVNSEGVKLSLSLLCCQSIRLSCCRHYDCLMYLFCSLWPHATDIMQSLSSLLSCYSTSALWNTHTVDPRMNLSHISLSLFLPFSNPLNFSLFSLYLSLSPCLSLCCMKVFSWFFKWQMWHRSYR